MKNQLLVLCMAAAPSASVSAPARGKDDLIFLWKHSGGGWIFCSLMMFHWPRGSATLYVMIHAIIPIDLMSIVHGCPRWAEGRKLYCMAPSKFSAQQQWGAPLRMLCCGSSSTTWGGANLLIYYEAASSEQRAGSWRWRPASYHQMKKSELCEPQICLVKWL